MKKKDRLIGTCMDYTHDCLGVVKVNGETIFVKNMIMGERAEIEIIKVLKNYSVGRVIRFIETSNERVEPLCPVYKHCGGCSLMHMSMEGQKRFKTERVKETLRKIGHCDTEVYDCLMDKTGYHYRNKVQVPFGYSKGKLVSGFYKARTNDIIENDHCLIQNEFSNKVTAYIKELMNKYHIKPYDKVKHTGLIKHVLTRYGTYTHEGMVVLISYRKDIPHLKDLVDNIVSKFTEIKSVILNVNQRHDNVILGDKEILLYGESQIHDVLLGNIYGISMKSFYQVNPRQVEVLYSKAIEYADLEEDDVVLDAYCGIGTIGLSLARKVKKVIGVEVVPDAIMNAKENMKRNHIDNAEFYCDDAGHFMDEYSRDHKDINVVVVDPPRKGCSTQFLESMVNMSPEMVVYISCNVATLARDIDYLQNKGYKVEKVQPVDMFPNTNHVECVVLMSKVKD